MRECEKGALAPKPSSEADDHVGEMVPVHQRERRLSRDFVASAADESSATDASGGRCMTSVMSAREWHEGDGQQLPCRDAPIREFAHQDELLRGETRTTGSTCDRPA